MSFQSALLLPEGRLKDSLRTALGSLGVKTRVCSDFATLSAAMSHDRVHLVILPETHGGVKAENFIAEAAKIEPRPAIVVGLDSHSMSRALELMNAGAWECVSPLALDAELEKVIKKGIERAESEPVRFPSKIPFWKNKWLAAGALFLLLIAAGLTALKIRHDQLERVQKELQSRLAERQFPLPYSHPSGISFQGNYFWISDWYAQSIYKHEPSPQGFVMLAVYHLSDTNPLAIAWEGEYLWVLSAGHKIQKYEVGQRLKLLQSAKTPSNNCSGLAYDGRNLWTSDAAARKVYRLAMDRNLTVDAEFDYPGQPVALFNEGPVLWSLEGEQNRLMRHKVILDQLAVEKTISLPNDVNRVGSTFDGERFWTLSENPPLAIRHAIANE